MIESNPAKETRGSLPGFRLEALHSNHPPRSHRTLRTLAWVLLVACLVGSPLSAAVFTVGPGGDCSHPTIQAGLTAAAANGPGQDEIRVIDTILNGLALDITTPVKLIGGYNTCSSPSHDGPTSLSGGAGASVITITGDIAVDLIDLSLSNGDPDTDFPNLGGAITIDGAQVQIEDSEVSFNAAGNGGAIQVRNGELTVKNTFIEENFAADDGGAIACRDSILTFTDTELFHNDAGRSGGGLHAMGCEITGTHTSIWGNRASLSAGGVDLSLSSTLLWKEDSDIEENSSLSFAGGLLLSTSSTATLEDSSLSDNTATFRSGGFEIGGASQLTMRRTANCPKKNSCSVFKGNQTTVAQGQAVMSIHEGSTVLIYGTEILGNSVNSALPGAPILASVGSVGSGLLVENSLVAHNTGGNLLFGVYDTSEVLLAFVTVTDNGSLDSVVDAVFPAQLHVLSSIIWEAGGHVLSSTTNPQNFDCVMAHELASAPSATGSVVADPQFVDPSLGNFQLAITSPAIDYCDDFFHTPEALDYLGGGRPWDTPVPNGFGAFDLGALENQLLFADGFESGDVSAWSSSN